MKIIVVGCGRVGSALAYRLYQKGHQVTIVDAVASAFENLPADFRGRTVEGHALNQDVLRRAGAERADAMAVVTNSDSLNAVVAHVAHIVYGLNNVVVRNYDPQWRPLHEAIGLQVISSASWGAQRIEELLYETDVRTVFSAGNGEVDVSEFTVPVAWHGRQLCELLPEGHCLAVALTRAGQARVPTPDTLVEGGDVVVISTTLDGVAELRKRLSRPKER